MYCSLSQIKTSSMDWNGPEWNKMAQNRKQNENGALEWVQEVRKMYT